MRLCSSSCSKVFEKASRQYCRSTEWKVLPSITVIPCIDVWRYFEVPLCWIIDSWRACIYILNTIYYFKQKPSECLRVTAAFTQITEVRSTAATEYLMLGGGCFKIKIVNFKRLCFISMVHSAGLCYILCYTLFIYFVIQFVKTVNSLENKASTSFLWPVVATLNLLESVSFPLTIFKSVRCPFCFHFVL